LNNKVDKVDGKVLSTNDFTTAYKTKLDGLEKITVDSELSKTSTNPVQNKAVQAKFDELVGDTKVSEQINSQLAGYTTKNYVDDQLSKKAAEDHTHDLSNANVGHANVADTATSVEWSGVKNKPSTYTPSQHNHVIADITDLSGTINSAKSAANSYTDSQIAAWVGDRTVSEQISMVTRESLNMIVSATEPTSPTAGMLWFDIS